MHRLLTRYFAVAAIMVASAAPTQAGIGLKAGINVSGMSGGIKSPPESGVIFGAGNVENQLGFFVGAFASLRMDVFSLQPEVVVSQKGGKGAFLIADDPGREVNGTLSMTYIEAPVLLLFHPPTEGKVNPYVGAGPATSLSHRPTTMGLAKAILPLPMIHIG